MKIRIKKHKQFVLHINNEYKPMIVYDNWKAQLHHEKKMINTRKKKKPES